MKINNTYILTEMDYSVLNSMCECCLDLKKCKNPLCKKKKLALWILKNKVINTLHLMKVNSLQRN